MTGALSDRYARGAAVGMLEALEHYGQSSPAVGDGVMSTPAAYANRLGKVAADRGDTLPGSASDWWGARWGAYAAELLRSLPVPVDCVGFADCPCDRCRASRRVATARHPGHPAGDGPYCGTCRDEDRDRHRVPHGVTR